MATTGLRRVEYQLRPLALPCATNLNYRKEWKS